MNSVGHLEPNDEDDGCSGEEVDEPTKKDVLKHITLVLVALDEGRTKGIAFDFPRSDAAYLDCSFGNDDINPEHDPDACGINSEPKNDGNPSDGSIACGVGGVFFFFSMVDDPGHVVVFRGARFHCQIAMIHERSKM